MLPPRGATEIHARANQVESFKQPLVKNRPSNPRGLCPVLVSTSADSWGIVGLSGHPEPQAHAGRGRCVGRGERRGAPPPLPHPSTTSLLLACVPPSPRFSFPAVSLASTRSGLIQKPHIICWCHLFGWALLPLPSHCPSTARPLPVLCPFNAKRPAGPLRTRATSRRRESRTRQKWPVSSSSPRPVLNELPRHENSPRRLGFVLQVHGGRRHPAEVCVQGEAEASVEEVERGATALPIPTNRAVSRSDFVRCSCVCVAVWSCSPLSALRPPPSALRPPLSLASSCLCDARVRSRPLACVLRVFTVLKSDYSARLCSG